MMTPITTIKELQQHIEHSLKQLQVLDGGDWESERQGRLVVGIRHHDCTVDLTEYPYWCSDHEAWIYGGER